MVGILVLLVISGLFFAPHSLGQTQGGSASDFATIVQAGLQSLAINLGARSEQQEIQSQDYKSTWDEFGTNVLIDGATAPAEVDGRINQDIVQTVQAEANYDREEAKYLEVSNVTPEEIQIMEESGGSDVPVGESIDPNPSAEANPDVSMSATEDQGQNDPEENTSTPQTTSIVPETNTSTSEVSTPSDETIFDAILQGEQAQEGPGPEFTPPPTEPPPAP